MIENATNMMDKNTMASAPALEHHFLDVESKVVARVVYIPLLFYGLNFLYNPIYDVAEPTYINLQQVNQTPMRPIDVWYLFSFIFLVSSCVLWQLRLPAYWAVSAALYLCSTEAHNMYEQGELWEPLGGSSHHWRSWRVRTGILLILSIIASCAMCIAFPWTNYMEWCLVFTSAVYLSTSVPACFALARHAQSTQAAASARSSLASCTLFHVMYGVFILLLSVTSASIGKSDDISWRTIASYLVWISILHLIYVEYPERGKSFRFVRFASFFLFYIILCIRLHDSADAMMSMGFTSALDWLILIICGVAFGVTLMHKFVNGAYISE